MFLRRSGILLHPTSFPGKYGIGEIGPHAYDFIDNLADMGQSLWQILPLGPTDSSHSPYSLVSVFAGNHQLISFDLLIEDELLDKQCLENFPNFDKIKVSFHKVFSERNKIFEIVCSSFNKRGSTIFIQDYQGFCESNHYWLDDFANFWALKQYNPPDVSWPKWVYPDEQKLERDRSNCKILQFLFHDQWSRLKKYSNERGIQIIGDMPIYVGYESADVWKSQHLFQLDLNGKMLEQAGCPPCNYRDSGQLWGNPLYNWEEHENSRFKWWIMRFEKLFEMVDSVRLDHFTGYSNYWSVPINKPTAKYGKWMKSAGEKLFESLLSTFGELNMIAEDLGALNKDVINLREKFNLPGMRILQFEFNEKNHPDQIMENSVVYNGTHDNDTLIGWLKSCPRKNEILKVLSATEQNIHWKMIEYALGSKANTVIISMQDILGLGSSSRFNIPGTYSAKNWCWRFTRKQLTNTIIKRMNILTKTSRRLCVNEIQSSITAEHYH